MDRTALEELQLGKLRGLLAEILPANQFYSTKLHAAGLQLNNVQTWKQFRQLPFTTKTELLQDQTSNPPYGTNLSYPLESYVRLHQSSGTAGSPLRWLDTPGSWSWFVDCWNLIFDVAEVTGSDRFFFPFSFGPFIAFWGAFEAAYRRGNLCMPGGGMTSVGRLRFILDNQATVIATTPTYALRLAEVASQENLPLKQSAVRLVIVAGEPGGSMPVARERLTELWQARVIDHSGMTEIGAATVECLANPGGVHVLEEQFIAEVIDPVSGQLLPAGQTGELILTNLGRHGSPLIRYRTGDLVCQDPQPCPCDRNWKRFAGGIIGRCDDMVVIRGNNVYPSAVDELIRTIDPIREYRCTVERKQGMTALRIEFECDPAQQIQTGELLTRAFQNRFHFKADIAAVEPDTLPRFELKARRWIKSKAD